MQVDKDVIQLLKQSISLNGKIKLPSEGNSMFPLIQKGDICEFISCEPSTLKTGEIILFWSLSGQLNAHRFHHRQVLDGQSMYFCKGDSNLGFDQPISQDRILGKLVLIKRQDRCIVPSNLRAIIWGRLLLTIPVLSGILRAYLNKNDS